MRRPTILEKIPRHLHPFVATQDPSLYTAIDHAAWRYILRVSKKFFAEHAHRKYLDGLEETGISTERIPLISEMDGKLERFGWRAVAVVGFIPPAVFMEFLSLGVLPIACDMRRLEHLGYTPAPDIVHEAAGHAPIIADQEYADYLLGYGEISSRVIFSSQDMAVYEAIRALSDTKEDPAASSESVAQAQARLDAALKSVDFVSEATQLARMSWWTIEYGLVGPMEAPKIYGAGLLSSVAEGYHCFDSQVKKIPFNLDCIKCSYDITRPQPQLFVTPDFKTLSRVLGEFASTTAFRRGGAYGLSVARRAATVTTAQLDSGAQVSGVLENFLSTGDRVDYLQFRGPCQLSRDDMEIAGHGAGYHRQGFGNALGKLKGLGRSPAALSKDELGRAGGRLEFESGVVVEGRLAGTIAEQGRNLVLSFVDCTVKLGDRVLFSPDWGTYDLACGERVVSVFGNAADRAAYLDATGGHSQKPASQKTNLTSGNRKLEGLYARVRELRESGKGATFDELASIYGELEVSYGEDWLLRLELLEFKELMGPLGKACRKRLEDIAAMLPDRAEMIRWGLELL